MGQVKLAKIREPPLLSQPETEQSPWVEITPEQIRKMKKLIRDNAERGQWRGFTWLAAYMKTLGLEVTEEVKQHETQIRKKLRDCSENNSWGDFTRLAASMRTLELHVADEMKGHEEQIRQTLEKYSQDKDWERFTMLAAEMETIGLDITEVRQKEKQIREKLKKYIGSTWGTYLMADMKKIGLEVKGEVKQHEKQIRQALQVCAKNKNWLFEFAWQAADMVELGLLTPNPETQQPHMPPLKTFKR